MVKFYTRDGDDGYTGRLGEGRLPKHHKVIETVGTIDEASAVLGLARGTCRAPMIADLILPVQRDLYHMMAEISATPEAAPRFRVIDAAKVEWLEGQIDSLGAFVTVPADFIVPGDTAGGAALALARTAVRKAERRVAELHHEGEVSNLELIRYLNRLSSLCFILELHENQFGGVNQPTIAKTGE
jgi:cob(I)alamin adenosyltransferase